MHPAIEFAARALPASLSSRSGKVFYSGRAAFRGRSDVYLLGFNPGGDPVAQAAETIGADIDALRARPDRWSAYADESWNGKAAGEHGLQPRVRHLVDTLGLDLQAVPASNLIFARTRNEASLARERDQLVEACWPFHRAVIDALRPRAIICLGMTTGRIVRRCVAADWPIGRVRERNARRWVSLAHRSDDGLIVFSLTHPGRAD